MKAIVISRPGGPEVLELREVEDPVAGEGEVLIKVVATALNRADALQREGRYAPPPGNSLYPGLECSGIIEDVGPGVSKWRAGDKVCALLGGGGYAEKVNVPAGQVLPIPKGVSLRDAAGFPEVSCTVWSTIFMMVHLKKGESVLLHGGGSGIGTFAIQIAKTKGVKVFITAGSDEKVKECIELGADGGINYKTEDFVERVKALTDGKGVDVVLDIVGGPYVNKNLEALGTDGRLFILGLQGGPKGEINLGPIIAKRLTITGAGLRVRTVENKTQIVQEVLEHVWPEIEAGKVKVVIDKVYPLGKAAEAHRALEGNHFGKILLTP
ncbi:hypothetical protein CY35_13G044300 [Sphagnum magellanicum]|nr:hypothetical protein CY35_13G044300 [Sphagnum magellanicum]